MWSFTPFRTRSPFRDGPEKTVVASGDDGIAEDSPHARERATCGGRVRPFEMGRKKTVVASGDDGIAEDSPHARDARERATCGRSRPFGRIHAPSRDALHNYP